MSKIGKCQFCRREIKGPGGFSWFKGDVAHGGCLWLVWMGATFE